MKYKQLLFIFFVLVLTNILQSSSFSQVLIWANLYDRNEEDYAYSIIQTTDGGYAVAGSTCPKDLDRLDAWILKLDNSGNLLWDKTYGGSGYSHAYSIIQTNDGGYALAGNTTSKGTSEDDAWILKLDNEGNILWEKVYDGSEEDYSHSIIQTTDGGYAVAGVLGVTGISETDVLIFKIDEK